MASVADHRDNNLLIFPIVGKNAFESVAEAVKVFMLGDLGLKDPRLDSGGSLVDAELTALGLEKVLRGGLVGEDVKGGRAMDVHARLRASGHLGRHCNSTGQELLAARM